MNNEPVAWISVLGVDLIGQKFTDVRVSLTKTDVASIPLYTHPVKEQDESFDRTASHMAGEYVSYKPELTDEEILSVIKCVADDVSPHKEYENTYSDGWIDACNTVYDEVFAILGKAQEK